jgi:hypothetical protein
MFSHPDDPPDVTEARAVELAAIRRWVREHAEAVRAARGAVA